MKRRNRRAPRDEVVPRLGPAHETPPLVTAFPLEPSSALPSQGTAALRACRPTAPVKRVVAFHAPRSTCPPVTHAERASPEEGSFVPSHRRCSCLESQLGDWALGIRAAGHGFTVKPASSSDASQVSQLCSGSGARHSKDVPSDISSPQLPLAEGTLPRGPVGGMPAKAGIQVRRWGSGLDSGFRDSR